MWEKKKKEKKEEGGEGGKSPRFFGFCAAHPVKRKEGKTRKKERPS